MKMPERADFIKIEKIEKKEEVSSKIEWLQKKLRNIAVVTGIFAAAATAKYEMEHPSLEITTGTHGEKKYKHPDEKTTHYLNVLARVDTLTDDDIFLTLKDAVIDNLKESGANAPAEIKDYSLDQLDQFTSSYKDKENIFPFWSKPGDLKKALNYLVLYENQKVREGTSSLNKKVYELVWQLEQECGNPKVRLMRQDDHTLSNGLNVAAYYNAMSNTIFVSSFDLEDPYVMIHEMAHGKQFKDAPIASALNNVKDNLRVLKNCEHWNLADFDNEYRKLYHDSETGNLEYQAHKIIKPKLDEKYPIITNPKQVKRDDKKYHL